jgi:hypothetical protein
MGSWLNLPRSPRAASAPVKARKQHGESPCRSMPELRS